MESLARFKQGDSSPNEEAECVCVYYVEKEQELEEALVKSYKTLRLNESYLKCKSLPSNFNEEHCNGRPAGEN